MSGGPAVVRWAEDELLPISGLQHLSFCPRQCALIHVEELWAENRLTAEGRVFHERVDRGGGGQKGKVRIARHVPVRSLRLGLTGIADLVEFHPAPDGVALPGVDGRWTAYPVEYKRGRPKRDDVDEVQLAAQAICLEEMLGGSVPRGALFYGRTRRREEVVIGEELRRRTGALAGEFRRIVESGEVPRRRSGSECERCSLAAVCMPDATSGYRSAAEYLRGVIEEMGIRSDR